MRGWYRWETEEVAIQHTLMRHPDATLCGLGYFDGQATGWLWATTVSQVKICHDCGVYFSHGCEVVMPGTYERVYFCGCSVSMATLEIPLRPHASSDSISLAYRQCPDEKYMSHPEFKDGK